MASVRGKCPRNCVGKHIARQHLAGMWAVVYDITFCIFLVEHAREEGTSVQTAVECSQLIDVVGLDFYSAQYFVPAVTTLLLQLIKAQCASSLRFNSACSALMKEDATRHVLARLSLWQNR